MASASASTVRCTIYCSLCQPLGKETGLHVCPRLSFVITQPHTKPRVSHHIFLILGQEPRLPVDFLLGRVQEPVAGSVHDWVQEHQTRLQVALHGALEQLQAAANRRKANHDQHVRDVPFIEGQLVFLRCCGHKGRHKIQDIWSPVVYQVVRAPKDGGVFDCTSRRSE